MTIKYFSDCWEEIKIYFVFSLHYNSIMHPDKYDNTILTQYEVQMALVVLSYEKVITSDLVK